MTLKVYDWRFRDGSTEMLYVSTDPLEEPSLEAGAAVREDLPHEAKVARRHEARGYYERPLAFKRRFRVCKIAARVEDVDPDSVQRAAHSRACRRDTASIGFSNVNQTWGPTRLGDVLVPTSRVERVNQVKEYSLLGVRLEGGGAFHRETKLGSELSASSLRRVETGDFIYSRLFAWRGAFGVIGPDLHDKHVSNEFPTFRPIDHKIDVEFLRLWFRLPAVIHKVEADCSGSTPQTRNRFKEPFFLALRIPLPAFSEQRRIVARIEKLAGRVEEARGLRRETSTEIQAMLSSAYRRIANGARRLPMSEVAPLHRRSVQVEPHGSYPELGVRSFGRGTFHKPSLSGLEVGSKKLFRIDVDDLLFNIVFAWEGAVAIAKPEDQGRVGSHRFLTCVPKPGLATSSFLCFHFLTNEGLEQLGKASPGGAGRNRTLGQKALKELEVPVPPFEEQLWFASLLGKVGALQRVQDNADAELDALLPSVLHRAFKGKL